jgi:hypothetical protein
LPSSGHLLAENTTELTIDVRSTVVLTDDSCPFDTSSANGYFACGSWLVARIFFSKFTVEWSAYILPVIVVVSSFPWLYLSLQVREFRRDAGIVFVLYSPMMLLLFWVLIFLLGNRDRATILCSVVGNAFMKILLWIMAGLAISIAAFYNVVQDLHED